MKIKNHSISATKTKLFSGAAKIISSHKVSSSVGAITLVAVSSITVGGHNSNTHPNTLQSARTSVNLNANIQTTDKSSVNVSYPDDGARTHTAANDAHQAPNTSGMSTSSTPSLSTTVQVNGQHVDAPKNSYTAPAATSDDKSTTPLSFDIQTHNETDDESKDRSTTTLRINSSTSSKTSVKSSESTRMSGGN